jgi:hypothetical protein
VIAHQPGIEGAANASFGVLPQIGVHVRRWNESARSEGLGR